jgi:peptidoglycan L-alanyl-D-glutamate endopeptidase CwlK
MPELSSQSRERLDTCHPLLQEVFMEVIKHRDCTILCGHRGREDQEQAFASGNSKARYGQSKHNYTPSLAIDVMPYPVNWDDMKGLHEFAGFVMGVAISKGIPIQWGGHFIGFFDGPHYELVGVNDARVPE